MYEIKQSILPNIPNDQKRNQLLSPFSWRIEEITKNKQQQAKRQKIKSTLRSKHANIYKQTFQNSDVTASKFFDADLSLNISYPTNKNGCQIMNPKNCLASNPFRSKKIQNKLNILTRTMNLESIKSTAKKVEINKTITFLDQKNNMEQYMKSNLIKQGWSYHKNQQQALIVWANKDSFSHHQSLRPGQYYNHLAGSFTLTNKDKLHQHLSFKGYSFYPLSFSIPKEYDQFVKQNNHIIIIKLLKTISKQITSFCLTKNNFRQPQKISLGQVLNSDILSSNSKDVSLFLKLGLYLQILRKQMRLISYFECFQNYVKVDIKPQQHLFQELIHFASCIVENQIKIKIDYSTIDYQLLMLILNYNQLFSATDIYSDSSNIWIIKPIASSRGAGISFIQSKVQYCSLESNLCNHFKNRRKYENKIIQRYLPQPYLLENPKEFSNRKFDIRQWVLVISQHNKPLIYKYRTAYCRFASEKYCLKKLDKLIHLTNYSISKNGETKSQTVMMLQDLFENCDKGLKEKYDQQVDNIILKTIEGNSDLKYHQNTFQLFGFDFFIDKKGMIYLLEINLNPACDSVRNQKLKVEAEIMAKSLFTIVTERRFCGEWKRVTDSYSLSENIPLLQYKHLAKRKITKFIKLVKKSLFKILVKRIYIFNKAPLIFQQ